MGRAIPQQHPAVVLRSHFNLVRNLLAVAMVAVVGLTIAVVLVANDGDEVISPSAAQSAPLTAQPALPDGLRYDGGPDEGTRGIAPQTAPAPGTRYDGGPDEGTRGIMPQTAPAPGTRYDGGPDEGTRGIAPQTAPAPGTRYDGGPDEGTRGPGFSTD